MTIEQPGDLLDSTGAPLTRMPDVIRPSTNAIIFNEEGDLLLERRSDNGFWGLPGGRLEIGESVEQGVIREALEETGLHVTIERLVGIYSDPKHHTIASYPDGGVVHYVVAAFECRRRGGELRISEESTDIGYFAVEALPDKLMLSHTIRIRDAAAHHPTALIK